MEELSTTDYIIIAIVAITVIIISIQALYNLGLKRGLPTFRHIPPPPEKPRLPNQVIIINRITKINFTSLGKSREFEIDKIGVNEIIHTTMLRSRHVNPDIIKVVYDDKVETYYGMVRVKVESINK